MNAGMSEQQTGDSEFERRTRELLVDSTDALPGAVRSRLTQARHAALGARTHAVRYRLQRWVPAGALAAAALALLVVFVPHTRPPATTAVIGGAADDIDLLTSDVPLSTDQDVDYSFYEWAVDAANSPTDAGRAAAAASGTNGS
jgi:hypothetical protein